MGFFIIMFVLFFTFAIYASVGYFIAVVNDKLSILDDFFSNISMAKNERYIFLVILWPLLLMLAFVYFLGIFVVNNIMEKKDA